MLVNDKDKKNVKIVFLTMSDTKKIGNNIRNTLCIVWILEYVQLYVFYLEYRNLWINFMVYTYSRYEDNKFKLPAGYKIIAFYLYCFIL